MLAVSVKTAYSLQLNFHVKIFHSQNYQRLYDSYISVFAISSARLITELCCINNFLQCSVTPYLAHKTIGGFPSVFCINVIFI
jgi:hypothetical protein